jgi:hypothetical protein
MAFFFAVMLQAVTASPPERVDLTIPQPCSAQRPGADGEVIVCANRNGDSPYRLTDVPEPAEGEALPKAEVKVAEGVSAGVETERTDVGGFDSNRAMVRLKVKF